MLPATPVIPDHLPPEFDAQLDAVNQLVFAAWKLATKRELQQGAAEMGMLAGDGHSILIGEETDNARHIEWTTFHIRRGNRPLIQAVAGELGHCLSPREQEILAALIASQWSLLHIEAQRPGVGAVMRDLWTGEQRVVFSRRIGQVTRVGEHLLARWVRVGGCTTLTAFISRIPREALDLLAALRLESGRCADQVIATDPPLREEFIRRIVALPSQDSSTMPIANGNRMRNQPCPCGSGRKFKVCCGAGG